MNWTRDFDAAVRQSFDGLLPLGYKIHSERSGDTCAAVRFVGPAAREVVIAAYPTRLEFDVTISLGESGVTTLFELEKINSDVHLPKLEYGIFEAHLDRDKLGSMVCVLAERFRLLALPILTGAINIERVHDWRDKQEQKSRTTELSSELSRAFKEKRWADVVKYASALGADAGKTNLMRLAYAQKQLNGR